MAPSGPIFSPMSGHAFTCKGPCTNIMCTNFSQALLDQRLAAQEADWRRALVGTQPMSRTSTLPDGLVAVDLQQGKRWYRIYPAGPVRRFWNWLRGYRP